MNQEFEYRPHGKTQGFIDGIPHDDCGICGYTMYQPLPTGIWLHVGNNDDFSDSENHAPRKATLLERLVIENTRSDNEGRNESCTCNLHQKYWLQQLGLDLDKNQLYNDIPKKIELEDDPDWPELFGKPDFGAYYWRNHPRKNYLKYAKFIVSRKQKYLKKNFSLYPKVVAEFYIRERKNSCNTRTLRIKQEYDYLEIPEPGDEIKLGDAKYIVINDCRNPSMDDMEIANIRIHIQPKSKAKKWMIKDE